MKLLVTGDFHIQKNNVKEVFEVLNQIYNYFYVEECEGLILLGDLFNDANPVPSVIKHMISFLQLIPKDKRIYIISGNHDIQREENALSWMPLIHPGIVFGEKGLKANVNNKTLNMMHIHVNESKLGPEDIKLNSISYKRYEEDIILLGHVHKPQIISEAPLVLHPGSPYYINFGERNDMKGFYILNIDKDKMSYKFVSLNVIPMKQIEVGEETIKKVDMQLDVEDKNTKIKLIFNISSYKPELINKIGGMIKKYNNKFYLFKYVLNIERQIIEVPRKEKYKTVNQLLEEFCKKEKANPEIERLLKDLLHYEN